MRSTLYLKFIIIYLIFGFVSFFCVPSLTSELMLENFEKETTSTLYRAASLMSSEYLPLYFRGEISLSDVRYQLDSMQDYTEANIWFVNRGGSMITSYSLPDFAYTAPAKIPNFDPAEHGSDTYRIGTYHNLFEEDMITIVTPVVNGYTTSGYLLIHKPYTALESCVQRYLIPVYATVFVIFLLSFCFLFAFHILVYIPLQRATDAAKQYALGNLDYAIPINTQDEMGYLSASLNYMASHLKDIEDAQKKFVGNVSHDFRSPLTSIKGYLEALSDGTIPVEMQDRYFKILLFETERLTELTRDLLTLNEFDTKNLMLNRTNFDIHELIKNTVRSFEGTCRNRHISIELLLSSRVLMVNADYSKIGQVIYNLLDNAIKFSPNDSKITIETTLKTEKVYISVKDYGTGIPKKELSKIWDRFYKLDASRGKDKKGTGLGLAIVKEVILAHSENINVISTEGVGTEFIFSLMKGIKKEEP